MQRRGIIFMYNIILYTSYEHNMWSSIGPTILHSQFVLHDANWNNHSEKEYICTSCRMNYCILNISQLHIHYKSIFFQWMSRMLNFYRKRNHVRVSMFLFGTWSILFFMLFEGWAYSRRFVRPPVRFSIPGHNSETTRGINMKLCR
jgi:hypothetical protein